MTISMKLIRKLIPLAAAAVLFAGATTGASAYQCKGTNTVGSLPAAQYAVALAGARADWTNKVRNNYGLSWSVWNIASGKQETCVPGGGGTTICVVKAKPCNYVVP
jgi:hypothetical protein